MDDCFRPAKAGWHWLNNKLKMFSESAVEVVEGCLAGGREGLRSWIKQRARPSWRGSWAANLRIDRRFRSSPSRDDGEVPADLARRRAIGRRLRWEAYRAWRATVPLTLQRLVSPYRTMHVGLLRLAVRTGGTEGPGAELLSISPGLSFAILHVYYFSQVHLRWDRVRSWLKRPQREIISEIGMASGTEAQARLLTKMEPGALTYSVLADLARTMGSAEAMKLLSHCERINRGVISLVESPEIREHVTVDLMDEVGGLRREMGFCPTARLIGDILRMSRALGRGCGRFSSRRQLLDRHAELVRRMGGDAALEIFQHQADLDSAPWPAAPLAGVLDPDGFSVQPIDGGWRQLLRHAAEQKHCAGSLAPEVLYGEGRLYFYDVRLGGGERATLLIGREGARGYRRRECKGRGNAAVSSALLRRIDAWLDSVQSRLAEPEEIAGEAPFDDHGFV